MLTLLALTAALAAGQNATGDQVLVTPHYTITLTNQCEEGVVGCDRMLYHAVSRTGGPITLHGKQIMQMCADGVTPCHSLGYRFRNGNVSYLVSEEGSLEIKQGSKTLLSEKGTWK